MKQTITEEQWGEINKRQKLIIAKMFCNDDPSFSYENYAEENSSVWCPLTIGRMIDFLMENGDDFEKIETDLFNKHRIVLVFKPQPSMNYGYQIRWSHSVELVDALWEVVKEILNQ